MLSSNSYSDWCLMEFLFTEALFLLTSEWITNISYITSLSVSNRFCCQSFPLHHLFKSCFVRQDSISTCVIFLSEINCAIIFALAFLSFGSSCTGDNLLTFTFVIFMLEKAVSIPVSLCLNPGILSYTKSLNKLRISIEIAS